MLSEDALERLSERLVDRIESLNTFFIKKIGKQIKTIGTITPSQLSELLQSVQYGNDIDEIMNKIAEVTDMNVKDIYKIFEEVAKKNQTFSKKFYDYNKVKFIPYEENKTLQEQVMSIAKATANEYINMSKTFAYMNINETGKKVFTSISDIYQKITDEAILSIAQGRESYQMAMKKSMKEMTRNGLRIVDYSSGYSRRADSSVRMNVMDGIRRLNREVQEQFGEEFGADGVEISHHKYAAPDHIDTIDGKQFSKNGEVIVDGVKYEDYNTINDSLARHVGELNCYHFPFQIVLGVSKPLHTKEELEADKEENEKGFEFEGNHYTMYEGTQLQRKIETKIRQYKDRQIGAKSIDDTDEVYHCQEKIRQLTDKYYDLHKVSGLPTKIDRLRVDGYRKSFRKNKNIKKDSTIQTINLQMKDKKYVDVTKEWLDNKTDGAIINRKYFVDKNGNKYIVDNKNVVFEPSENEIRMANWLKETFGGNVYLNPKINFPNNVKTSDYLWNNEFWDLKELGEKAMSETRAIDNIVKKSKYQTDNIILDITNTKLSKDNIIEQVQKVYITKGREWIDKIVIVDNYKLIKIYKRNKKRG